MLLCESTRNSASCRSRRSASGIESAWPIAAGDTVRIVRIDQQRRFAFLSRSSGTRQDKHSWVVGILRCNIFLGNEVHTITQRGHEPNTRGAIEPGKCRVAVGTVDVANRRPVCLTIGAVDAPRGNPFTMNNLQREEISKPKAQKGNRKIPDVCDDLKVKWMRDFDFYKALNFTTK